MTIDERIAKLEKELAELKEEREKEKTVTRFEPEQNEDYLFVDRTGEIGNFKFDIGSGNDKKRMKYNNVFRITSEANLEKYAHDVIRVQNRLMQLHEELCPDIWMDSYPFPVTLWCNGKKWDFECRNCYPRTVPFSVDAAEKACEILNAEKFMIGDDEHEVD